MAAKSVVLLLASTEDEALWRTALASQQVVASALEAPAGSLTDAMRADSRLGRAGVLIADLPALSRQRLPLPVFARWARERWPNLRLVARLPSRAMLSPAEEAWAVANGASAIVAGQSLAAVRASLVPALGKVVNALELPDVDAGALENFLRVMGAGADGARAAAIGRAHSLRDWLSREGIGLEPLAREMTARGGVAVEDRSYRGKTYRQCFVGTEALAWMRGKAGLSAKAASAAAEALGRCGFVHHVVREHVFADASYYFRFDGLPSALDRIDLDSLAREMRGAKGVPIGTRTYLGKAYENCFVGGEAVDWLVRNHRLAIGEAEAIGQRLDDLGAIHHVVDEHGFVDAPYFYRFMADELER